MSRVAFYLAGYLLMTLLSFLIMIVVANHSRGDDILHFNGLARRSPFLAFGMLIAMLSLAGVPFTAGFIGKFLVFAAAVQAAAIPARRAGNRHRGGRLLLLSANRGSDVLAGAERNETESPSLRSLGFTIGALIFALLFFGVFPWTCFSTCFTMRRSVPRPGAVPRRTENFKGKLRNMR